MRHIVRFLHHCEDMNKMDFDNIRKMRITDFDYFLPDNQIAKYPLAERDASKLLEFKDGLISDDLFSNIANHIPEKSLLITNNTKVIQARLVFHKSSGARIEIFCLEPILPADFILNFQQTKNCVWKCIVGNLKKWKEGKLEKKIIFENAEEVSVIAEIIENNQSHQHIKFSWDKTNLTFSDILDCIGETPIPPYLNRDAESLDRTRYQTVYSKIEGSVAAPTAGLHFTSNVLQSLKEKKIITDSITLHVGAGTFKPVKSEYISDHEMHTEHFFINKSTLQNILINKNHLFAVGTTSLRTLESLYWLGIKIMQKKCDFHISQWEYCNQHMEISMEDSIQATLSYLEKEQLPWITASTQIMIVPGYKIKSVKGIITNFHQPKSTLLLLISAMTGNFWKDIYNHALQNNYRFLSYGDSSIIFQD